MTPARKVIHVKLSKMTHSYHLLTGEDGISIHDVFQQPHAWLDLTLQTPSTSSTAELTPSNNRLQQHHDRITLNRSQQASTDDLLAVGLALK